MCIIRTKTFCFNTVIILCFYTNESRKTAIYTRASQHEPYTYVHLHVCIHYTCESFARDTRGLQTTGILSYDLPRAVRMMYRVEMKKKKKTTPLLPHRSRVHRRFLIDLRLDDGRSVDFDKYVPPSGLELCRPIGTIFYRLRGRVDDVSRRECRGKKRNVVHTRDFWSLNVNLYIDVSDITRALYIRLHVLLRSEIVICW